MDGLDTLTESLARRTPEQLAALLARHAESLSRRPAPTTLRELAVALWSYETLHHVLLTLDAPRLHVLAATARIGQRLAEEKEPPRPAAPAPDAGHQSLIGHRLSFPQLAAEPVPREALQTALDDADAPLLALCEDGLAVLTPDGRIAVPPRIPQLLGTRDLGPYAPPAEQSVPAPVDPTLVREETQAAATTLAATTERLLGALAAEPVTLRKSGGVAVRETKRLAKAAGTDETYTRLLLDVTLAAGLIALSRDRTGMTALPTSAYDDWLALPPGERLALVLTAWLHLPKIPTWSAFGEPPTALADAQDRYAAPLRLAVLKALAAQPGRAPDAAEVIQLVAWHRPLAVIDQPMAPERVTQTVQEATFLGLVAYGALTPLGRALLDSTVTRDAALDPALRTVLATLLPPPIEQAHFQADLTAVTPGAPSAHLAELLASTADRESDDHAVTWRFTLTSVRRALNAGHAAGALLADLTAASTTAALPQPLTYLIEDAARTHGRMRVVSSACCIRSDDEPLIRELAAHQALRALSLRVIAPTVLVSTHPPATTLAALRAAGYAPSLEAETGTTVIERAPSHRAKAPAPSRNPTSPLTLAQRLLGSTVQ